MLIVKDIEIIEVERDPWETLSTTHPYEPIMVMNHKRERLEPIEIEVFRELIHGQRFIRPDGKEIVIGCSKLAQEIIGIQYEAWNNMSNEMISLQNDVIREMNNCKKLNAKLYELKNRSWLTKLLDLFMVG